VERIVSVSAVGSLKEEHKPLDFVIPSQFYDRTRHRADTFFGDGIVAHIGFGDPVCGEMTKVVRGACKAAGVPAKLGGTYICMEGPQFSTKAESNVYRSWGADVIGMTNLQEAKLAREAEICYATLALITDYDCWHPDHDSVTVDLIIANLLQNAATAQRAIAEAVGRIDGPRTCECATALASALITRPELVPERTKEELAPIIGKYMK
jgi:5'-methylthioadenosine phosphorylase